MAPPALLRIGSAGRRPVDWSARDERRGIGGLGTVEGADYRRRNGVQLTGDGPPRGSAQQQASPARPRPVRRPRRRLDERRARTRPSRRGAPRHPIRRSAGGSRGHHRRSTAWLRIAAHSRRIAERAEHEGERRSRPLRRCLRRGRHRTRLDDEQSLREPLRPCDRPLHVLVSAVMAFDAPRYLDQPGERLFAQTRSSQRSAGTSKRTVPRPRGSGTYSTCSC